MSSYVGIYSQIQRNNRKSVLLLLAFPLLLLSLIYVIVFVLNMSNENSVGVEQVNTSFLRVIPWVSIAVFVWFLIAFMFHNNIINSATKAKPLSRKENLRVYNLVENLSMSVGMSMPKVNIIEDTALNAYASGLNEKSYTVTLTRGIINKLSDEELEGVIAHELMHIRNRDVRLLVISIIFVGIFTFLAEIAFRSMLYGGRRSNKKGDGKGMILIYVAILLAYFISLLFKFALSRKREYMADAGAADMTKNPKALAMALRKISGNSQLNELSTDSVKELFIDNYQEKKKGFIGAFNGFFATHPPIEKRISILENI